MANDQDPATHHSPYATMFEHFRHELDEHHDRRERIIKASRDVTAASKKIIFTLQRVRQLGVPLIENVHKSNKQYYDTIKDRLSSISPDVQGLNFYRYARQFSPGCQEYMEAALFEHYLATGHLLSFEEAAQGVQQHSRSREDQAVSIALTHEDYLLGLFDMTGELMRFAITTMATTGTLPSVESEVDRNVLNDLRNLRSELETLEPGYGPFANDVNKKMDVMKQSVEKVEKSLYGLTVRGAERPRGWMPDTQTVEVEV
ncbi:hypothetical protein AMS68_003248 [Peltaster fructicola]|uniref:Translin n=1 Tax=Peltaster fructicola TaxID=286661 RepID=A0A6H0XSU2_9PEZI|nr:hypothetical protein AMS68_003248 [Peltaster fructicola]